jgi:hypothetical protein
MADTIVSRNILNLPRRLVVRAEIQSDGTGSTDAILVDKSTYTGLNGSEPGRFVVERIDYVIDGMQVILEFDHGTDSLLMSLGGNTDNSGTIDFTQDGMYPGFTDPLSGDSTGDIVATTVGHSAGDKASFVFYLRKKD